MPIVTFWSDRSNETAQTLSISALATYMAIEHNYRMLLMATQNNDTTIEDCFWDFTKKENLSKTITNGRTEIGLESGIEGFAKIISSNKNAPEIIKNYTRVVFRDRLDVLTGPKVKKEEDYRELFKLYPDVLQLARRYYDMILVDLNKGLEDEVIRNVLSISDVIVVNISQRLSMIEEFLKLREQEEFLKKKNVLLVIGRYDRFSKYTSKNISRYYKEKGEICTVPYNTLLFEACGEGKLADLMLRIRNIDETDRNGAFVKELKRLTDKIIFKLEELQMKM